LGERKQARRSSREENRGTAQIPPLSLSLSSTLPTRQSKNTGRRGREKEGAGGARNPNSNPKSWSNLSIRGASGSDRVGGFGGAAMNEKASVSKELNAKHKKVRLLLPAPRSSPFSEYFRRSGPRAAALIDKRIEGESFFVCG